MATKSQIDQLTSDVLALVASGVSEIKNAVGVAQNASNDPAIDDLDIKVTNATRNMTSAAAVLTGTPDPSQPVPVPAKVGGPFSTNPVQASSLPGTTMVSQASDSTLPRVPASTLPGNTMVFPA